MIRNYLITAIRNLSRYRTYSTINIFGLTVGLATSVLIYLWVSDELSYDKFYNTDEEIYRIQANFFFPNGSIETYAATTYNLAEAARNEIPEIKHIARTVWPENILLKNGDRTFIERGFYADSSLLSILTLPVLKGNGKHPLPDSKSIVITERTAKKLFGDEDPIGKVIQVNQQYDLVVSAVVMNVPSNSSVQFDWLCLIDLWVRENPWCSNWHSGAIQTFVTLTKDANVNTVNQKFAAITKRNCSDCNNQPFLYNLDKLHLYGEFKDGKAVGGKIQLVQLMSVVGLIILIIACINFMNLATARSATRAREVGVRKSIGALQRALVLQFVLEAMLLSFFSLVLALGSVQLLLPLFNHVTGKEITLDLTRPQFLGGIVLIALFCGLIAGSYPALFLSSLRPAQVLKGGQATPGGGVLRRALVVVQFVASLILVVCSLVIYDQIRFIGKMDLGFERENIIVIDIHNDLVRNASAFKEELHLNPAIKGVAFGGSDIFQVPITTRDPKWPTKQDGESVFFKVYRCDEDFIPLMSIKLMSGRNFTDRNNEDASNYIVNQKAVEAMGLSAENAVGTELEMWNGKGTIIGVTENFKTGNLHEPIEPLIFMFSRSSGLHYFIRIDGDPRTLAYVENVVKKFDPDYPFQYSYLSDVFNAQYRSEATMGELALAFTTIAITISCLGLFGLSLFTAERRVKELGIRKVLGASTGKLVMMLCSDFMRLIGLALIVAWPCAWYVANLYLNEYAFHTQITIRNFALPSVVIILLAMLTVGYQSFKASSRNPVNSLRSE